MGTPRLPANAFPRKHGRSRHEAVDDLLSRFPSRHAAGRNTGVGPSRLRSALRTGITMPAARK